MNPWLSTTLTFGAILALFVALSLYDRERFRRMLAEQRLANVERSLADSQVTFVKLAADMRAMHREEIERLQNVWLTQHTATNRATVIPAPPDAESRVLELIAKDQAAVAQAAIAKGADAVLADAQKAGVPCSPEEARAVATSMYAQAMGGAGLG